MSLLFAYNGTTVFVVMIKGLSVRVIAGKEYCSTRADLEKWGGADEWFELQSNIRPCMGRPTSPKLEFVDCRGGFDSTSVS